MREKLGRDNSLRVREALVRIQRFLDLLKFRVVVEPVVRVCVVGRQAGVCVVDVHAQCCARHCFVSRCFGRA